MTRSIVNIVRNRLRQGAGRTPTEHPDANLLTAFIERTLPQHERAPVMAHLAECADCREYVALSSSTAVPESAGKDLRRFSPVWRWVAGAAAVACLVALVVQRQFDVSHPEIRNNPSTAAVSRKAENSAAATASVQDIEKPKRKRRVSTKPAQQQIATAKQKAALEQAARVAAAPPQVANNVTPPPQVNPPVEQQVVAGTAPEREIIAPVPAPAVSNFTGGADYSLRTKDARSFGIAMKAVKPLTRLSALWSIDASGALQRSIDNGKTWQVVHVADGDTALKGRIVRVDATPSAHIRIATDSGEEWISEDGGVSWRRVRGH